MLTIRDARREDAAAVAGLLAEMGYPATAEEAASHIERFLADPASRLMVAERLGVVLGLVGTHIVPRLDADRLGCRVTDIAVASTERRSGIGTALIHAAEAEARERGATRLDLSSGEWRSDAYAFYASLGFESRSRGFTRRLG